MRPLVCFGLVLIVGAIGFSSAKNGFSLIGFLIRFIPCSLIACALGTVFAVKAYRGLPSNHKGKHLLTAVILLVVLGIALCLLLAVEINSIPP